MELITWGAMVAAGLITFLIGKIWGRYSLTWITTSSIIFIVLGMIPKVTTSNYYQVSTVSGTQTKLLTITHNIVPFNYVLLLFGCVLLVESAVSVWKIYSQKYYDNYK